MTRTLPFEEDAVRQYLDERIRHWRKQSPEFAFYYIDAYQSIRETLFGEQLPMEEE